ncbi:glycerophosphodiester phosphodiesterase family protein [Loktanella agnita]|uniref:glycerophosphodiester phosphodiesterase family protein n=1 Tax=Loktanella agnita TaxID=287097 RepID=UPI0039873982
MSLPPAFLDRPFAHRALHDRKAGRVENSMASIRAAIDAGYGIEMDVQLTSDGHAMVFHDDLLDRLTAETGPVRARSRAELAAITLSGDSGAIPALDDVLVLVAGQVPLLIEIKDQDGNMGPDNGPLEQAVANALQGYQGDVALMSFNPHSVAAMADLSPHIPRGLTTSSYDPRFWPDLSAQVCDRLRDIPDYARTGACFISHEAPDLDRHRVAELKQHGASILCWTVRSAKAEAQARQIADNVTFEGYMA